MKLEKILIFAVLDNGNIHQVILTTEQREVIEQTLFDISSDGIKVGTIDFSDVMELPNK